MKQEGISPMHQLPNLLPQIQHRSDAKLMSNLQPQQTSLRTSRINTKRPMW